MSECINFKQNKTYEERIHLAEGILKRYPDKIPLIILKSDIKLQRYKYLIPRNYTARELLYKLRECNNSLSDPESKINKNEALYILTEKGNFMLNSQPMEYVYNNYKSDDMFLYITLQKENTFGN